MLQFSVAWGSCVIAIILLLFGRDHWYKTQDTQHDSWHDALRNTTIGLCFQWLLVCDYVLYDNVFHENFCGIICGLKYSLSHSVFLSVLFSILCLYSIVLSIRIFQLQMAAQTESDSAILPILQIQRMDLHLGVLSVATMLCLCGTNPKFGGSLRRKLVAVHD